MNFNWSKIYNKAYIKRT